MPTLGQTLRSTREAKRMKLTQAAERTKIPMERLQALETDNYHDLPDDVYLKGAIRNYAILLDLNPTELVALYREARPEEAKERKLTTVGTRTRLAVVPAALAVLVLVVLVLVALFALHVIVL